MFDTQNTNGFTAEQLETLNAVLKIRLAAGDDKHAAQDAINNAWVEGDTVETLAAKLNR